MKQERIVFKGTEFTLEWYFDARGKSGVFESFQALSTIRKKKLFVLFRLLGNFGKVFNKEKFRYEGDQIYVLKASQDRLLCFFFDGAKIIITNAYEKKSSKMPKREKLKSLNAKKDYIKRCKEKNYYE